MYAHVHTHTHTSSSSSWVSNLTLGFKKLSLGKFSYGRKYMHIKSNKMSTTVTFSVSCSSHVWAEEANHITQIQRSHEHKV